MSRFLKASLVGVMALGTLLISAPSASGMPARVGFRGGFGGGFYGGGGWYGGGWGPGWYAGYGLGWYGPGYYYGAPAGKVKIVTPDKTASVYVDGGYAGPVAKMKKFSLRPGTHDVELRGANGQSEFHEQVQVIRGHTTEVNPAHS